MKNSPSLPPVISAILNANTTHDLSPKTIAEIVQFCIEHETNPGGPYSFNTSLPDELIVNKLNKLFSSAQPALNNASASTAKRTLITTEEQQLQAKAYRQLHDSSALSFNAPAKDLYNKVLQRIKVADSSGEISLLAYYFRNSLRDAPQFLNRKSDDDNLLIAQANILTWTAYTIIDTLLDDLPHQPHVALEVTLGCIRRAVQLYSQAGIHYEIQDRLFSAVDQANTDELEARKAIVITAESSSGGATITLASIPSASILKRLMARKSIAHTIGPHTLVTTSPQAVQTKVITAFELYCGARQLLDDMYDWQTDLHNGHLTYVIAKLFEHSGTVAGSYSSRELIQTLKQTFWNSVLEECCKEIIDMTERSRLLLEANLLKRNSSFIAVTIHPIQRAAKSALLKHTVGKELVTTLSSQNPS